MSKRIKLYGERNTNTRYMSQLIKLNLQADQISGASPVRLHLLQKWVKKRLPGNETVEDLYFRFTFGKNLGWKHSCVQSVEKLRRSSLVNGRLTFITITKNPYAWLLSMHHRPYHHYYAKKPDFLNFLRTPWQTIGRDNTVPSFKNPIELWNNKNGSYLQLQQLNALNLTSERLIIEPEAVVVQLNQQFGIPRSSEQFVNHTDSTKESNKDYDYYRNYYAHELWREKLPNEAIAIINESLDKQLMAHYGYEVLSP